MELFDFITKYSTLFVAVALPAGIGAHLGAYLKKKGENLATHEDIRQLVDQVKAVTVATKEIEARISDVTWKRERKYEWQLKAIESFNATTSEYIANVVENRNFRAGLVWFAGFDATGALIKALFDENAYAAFKRLQDLIGPSYDDSVGKTAAEMRLYQARDSALKTMLESVVG